MEHFGTQLSAARKAKGYTQEQLAEKLTVSRTNISRWESGKMVPDIDTIKLLSQILEYNFFAEEGMAVDPQRNEDSVQAVQDESVSVSEPKKFNARKWIPMIVGAVLICVAVIVGILMNSKTSTSQIASGEANVEITPTESVVYAMKSEDFEGGAGWMYEFKMEETAGVPFTIDELTITVIGDAGGENNMYYSGEQVAEWFGSATLQTHEIKSMDGGFPLDAVAGVRLTIDGTDANGNELSFAGYVEMSKEIKE